MQLAPLRRGRVARAVTDRPDLPRRFPAGDLPGPPIGRAAVVPKEVLVLILARLSECLPTPSTTKTIVDPVDPCP